MVLLIPKVKPNKISSTHPENRASILQKRNSGHGFQAVKQAPGAGYKVNNVIEITVSYPSAHLNLTDQINLKDNEKTAVIIL